MSELNKIERYVNISLGININQKTRKRQIVDGRFLFYAIAKKCPEIPLKKISLDEIGKYLGRNNKFLTKDHATVLHGINVFKDVLILEKVYGELYNSYVYDYLVRKSIEEDLTVEESEESNEIIEFRNKELKTLINKISLLDKKVSTLEDRNIILKQKLKEKIPFLKGYYNLEGKEQETVKERLNLIIRLMPSNQKRKEVFEIINCQS